MTAKSRPAKDNVEQDLSASQRFFADMDLRGFKQATNDVMQDAINVWDDLWAELEHQQMPGEDAGTQPGFEPSCGWNEFLQKMWILRNHLSFVKRITR